MGAGIIFYKENPLRILTLMAASKKGRIEYDLPKGREDFGESKVETAIRECLEEINIEVTPDQIEGHISIDSGRLTLFIVGWDEDFNPEIVPNPETGLVEHIDWFWTSVQNFGTYCPNWMRGIPIKFLKWFTINRSR